MDQNNSSFQVQRFCRQYFQLERELDFPTAEYLRDEEVQRKISFCINDPLRSHSGPPPRYKLRAIKELVSRIEASINDWDKYGVNEDFMEALAEMMAAPLPSQDVEAQKRSYVTYHLSELQNAAQGPEPTITLLESRSLISQAGTTGLRTWEAALHLGNYLCNNDSDIRGQSVLELGAGTGYLSILAIKHLGAQRVIATDGSDEVINLLSDNFYLNGLQDNRDLVATALLWGHSIPKPEETEWGRLSPIDTVIGADITYDQRVIPSLVATITELRVHFPDLKIIISATQRNEETFQTFVGVCRNSGFNVEFMTYAGTLPAQQTGPFYNTTVPIHIVRLN
ncbi:Protein-lysine N-methyltransferase EFM3 [Ceratocystis fimbriata CBS 114723]|uniref:Protein-lysine N-methyltransferase EFM3 n=1 Tax=Ceratocystis fimbriata CBS 114723 TaxID=1035309 RepID=A0A2C5WXV0_9PEZI|nr:Protein-lysine N-methyltransferase EFM3 [Ceratocystis fimbriata CBS 114723]